MYVDYDVMTGTLGNIHMYDLTNYPCETIDPRDKNIDDIEQLEFFGLRD